MNPISRFLLLLTAAGLFFLALTLSACDEPAVVADPRPEPEPIITADGEVTLLFGGDVMMARLVGEYIEAEQNGDYGYLFDGVADAFAAADLVFVNLESIISDVGTPLELKIGPKFRADPKAVFGLVDAGVGIVSIANNHAFDYGKEALADSIMRLRGCGIQDVGGGLNLAEAAAPVVIPVRNPDGSERMRIAFLAFNRAGDAYWEAREDSCGTIYLTDETLTDGIVQARQLADLVIVSMHFGIEYQTEPSEDQEYFAQLAIDLGADLVVGHHPHVVQPIVSYLGKPIAYSLGNLVFDQEKPENRSGALLQVTLRDREIAGVTPLPFRINDTFQPVFE